MSFRFNLHIRSLAINGTGQVSEHNNACFNALPPLRLTFQRHSTVFWYSMPWLQVLSNTKSVILGSQSTIKSIIVPLTNMGYLCSLKKKKKTKLLYILRHSSVTWSYSKLQLLHIKVCKHVFIADSLIQNLHTLTHKGLQACLHCTERYLNQCMWACCVCVSINFYFPFS